MATKSLSAAPAATAAPAASDWVRRWTHLIPTGASVLDLACGRGRHMQWLQQQGLIPVGVDRDAQALIVASAFGEVVQADLENQAWPFNTSSFAGIVVTNYLWRDRWADLLACLQPGGVLIYETFASGNETVGKPSNPDFLLKPGELLSLCKGLRVVGYEDGFCQSPDRFVQRIAAVQVLQGQSHLPERHALTRPGH
jgi:SAM-dependent methyltransferase